MRTMFIKGKKKKTSTQDSQTRGIRSNRCVEGIHSPPGQAECRCVFQKSHQDASLLFKNKDHDFVRILISKEEKWLRCKVLSPHELSYSHPITLSYKFICYLIFKGTVKF